MTDSPVSDTAPLLAPPSDETALERLWDLQGEASPRGPVSMVLGRSPLTFSAHLAFLRTRGEFQVTESLRELSASGESWRVLHTVPVGAGVRDIGHVLIGPGGVFTVDVKNHVGRRIRVTDHEVVVDGQVVPFAAELDREAQRAAHLLGRALGSPVQVHPLVVVVGASSLKVAPRTDGITVIPLARLIRHLTNLPPRFSVDDVRELTRAALKPRTWEPRPALEFPSGAPRRPSAPELRLWFAGLRREVRRAARVRACWAVGTLAALAAVVSEIPHLLLTAGR